MGREEGTRTASAKALRQDQAGWGGGILAGEEGACPGRREPGWGSQSGQDQRMSSRDRGDRVSSIMGSG